MKYHRTKLVDYIPFLLFAIFVCFVGYITVNIPLNDDYLYNLQVMIDIHNSPSLIDKLKLLYEQTLEHRVVTYKLISQLQYSIFGSVNYRSSNMIGCLAMWPIYKCLTDNNFIDEQKPYFNIILALLLFVPIFKVHDWAIVSNGSILVCLFSFLSLKYIIDQSNIKFILGIFFAILAMHTFANGLIVPILCIGLLLSNKAIIKLGIAISIFSVFYFFYFNQLNPLPVDRPPFIDLIRYFFIEIVIYCLLFITNFLKFLVNENILFLSIIGIGIVGFYVKILLDIILNKKNKIYIEKHIIAYLIFIVATCGMTAVGRISTKDFTQALTVRYEPYSVLLFCILILVSLRLFMKKPNGYIIPIMLFFASISFLNRYTNHVPVMLENKNSIVKGLYDYVYFNDPDQLKTQHVRLSAKILKQAISNKIYTVPNKTLKNLEEEKKGIDTNSIIVKSGKVENAIVASKDNNSIIIRGHQYLTDLPSYNTKNYLIEKDSNGTFYKFWLNTVKNRRLSIRKNLEISQSSFNQALTVNIQNNSEFYIGTLYKGKYHLSEKIRFTNAD